MKGFVRKETRFSLCGLNCALCSMHLGGYCPGCGGGAGNQSCAIAKCSLAHGGVPFCWECPEYPCSHYDGFDDGDSFVPHRNRQQDIARAQELGLEAHLTQLAENRAILDALLAGYNDGRRKTFFHTGRTGSKGAGHGRRGTAPTGGGSPGHQPEAEQESEEGVSLCRLPR